jgi:ribosomal protein S18 acetylase RimI-like enzyme
MTKTPVRRVAGQDVETVLDLWEEMMSYHARLDGRFQSTVDAREAFRETLQQWMADESKLVLVAEQQGKVIGYIIGHMAENPPVFELRHYGHVSDICVAPGWRRRGVGRKLFAALRDWFDEHGFSVLQLSVAARNNVSQTFWREMGFEDFTHKLWLER